MTYWKGRDSKNGLKVHFGHPQHSTNLSSDFKKPNMMLITIRDGSSDYTTKDGLSIDLIEITGTGKTTGEFNCKFYGRSVDTSYILPIGSGKIKFAGLESGKSISYTGDEMQKTTFEISGPVNLSFTYSKY